MKWKIALIIIGALVLIVGGLIYMRTETQIFDFGVQKQSEISKFAGEGVLDLIRDKDRLNNIRFNDSNFTNQTTGIIRTYNTQSKRITIINGSDITEMSLITEYTTYVPKGNNVLIAELNLTLSNDSSLSEIINSINFYDINRGYDLEERNYTLIIGRDICEDKRCNISSTNWSNIFPTDFSRKNIKIGIFTEVKEGDNVEWMMTIKGIEIPEWAEFDYTNVYTLIGAIGDPAGMYQNGTFFWIFDFTDALIYQHNMQLDYLGTSISTENGSNTRGLTGNGTGGNASLFYYTNHNLDFVLTKFFNGTNQSFFDVNPPSGFPHGLCNNETFFWTTDLTDGMIYQFYMNGTYTQSSVNWSTATGDTTRTPSGCTANSTHLWTVNGGNRTAHKFWTNLTYTGRNFNISGEGIVTADHITDDGTFFYISDNNQAKIFRYRKFDAQNIRIYNFSDYTNSSLYFGSPAGNFELGGGTNGTATNYTNTLNLDNSNSSWSADATNDEPYQRINMTINEDENTINYLVVKMNGGKSAIEGLRIYVYNFSASAWLNLSWFPTTKNNVTLTFNTNQSIKDVINSEKQIIIYIRGENFEELDRMHLDYFSLEIGYENTGSEFPQWSSRSVNDTTPQILDQILFSTQWTDNVALSSYIFEWNATGVSCNTVANDSTVLFTGTTNWSNISKQIPATCLLGDLPKIAWRVYANDSSNNKNATPLTFSFVAEGGNCWTNGGLAPASGVMGVIPTGCMYRKP